VVLAGLILACARNAEAAIPAEVLRRCASRLSPDNIRAHPPLLFDEPGLARAVVNPGDAVRTADHGVLLGVLFEDAPWSTLGSPPPDGTFAIARHDASRIELLTDVFASRTIWYLHTDDLFLASTSQRALVALTGEFAPSPEAVTWMAASGNLGPRCGWDRRLQRVAPATRLCLDRATWSLASSSVALRYHPRDLPEQEHLDRLRDSILTACAELRLDGARTALTLSGGYDSRSLLLGLTRAGTPVTCLTWGLKSSLADAGNDATIARQLAARFGLRHEYLELDPGARPVRECFSRFLLAGEGRIEDFSGYTDGFDAWRHIFEEGISVVVRGDSPGWGFPFEPINDFVARSIVHETTLVDDYPEGELIHALALAPQHAPDELFMADGESLDHYRDRIYNDFELPACMAAFNEVKCAYVEVVNPLFARGVVTVASELPDRLRHMRYGFERVVADLLPDVPFAPDGADEPLELYLKRAAVEAELVAELSSEDARRVFPGPGLDGVVADLERPLSEARRRLRGRVRAFVPERFVRAVRPVPRPHLDARALAYRLYIASRMAAILRDDAAALRRSGDRSTVVRHDDR
jgi:hypothetical protein